MLPRLSKPARHDDNVLGFILGAVFGDRDRLLGAYRDHSHVDRLR